MMDIAKIPDKGIWKCRSKCLAWSGLSRNASGERVFEKRSEIGISQVSRGRKTYKQKGTHTHGDLEAQKNDGLEKVKMMMAE